jgi:DNA-binding NarL/FixJ family response regulator
MLYDADNPISVVIADDHEVVRAGIRRLISIEKTLRVLDEAKNGRDAVELVKYHKPTIALLDILMPVMTGIDAIKVIKEHSPDTFIVMLTAFEDSKHLERAISAGADGYLTKDIGARDLVAALKTVVEGERVFSKSIIMIMQNKMVPSSAKDENIVITKREQEILNLVAVGKKSSDIAESLNISIRTVESHRYNIMQKLGIKNAAGLVRYAVMNAEV